MRTRPVPSSALLKPTLLALALVLGAACAHAPPEADGRAQAAVLEAAAARLEGGKDAQADARTLALGGFHALLVRGDARAARERFDAAVARDAAEPWGLWGQHVLARREAQPPRALAAALALCARAPRHALCALGARYALDAAGRSPALDDTILEGARGALQAGAAGDAAHLLRSAEAAILAARGEGEGLARVLADAGSLTEATLVGPFSPFQVLGFDTPPPPERDGSLAGPFRGPDGEALAVRTLRAPDGRLDLSDESARGDVYVLAVDVQVAEGGDFVLRTSGQPSHRVVLDGARVLERRDFVRAGPSTAARVVRLAPGAHRLLVTLTRANRGTNLWVALGRLDGRPASLAFRPAQGAPPAAWRAGDLTKDAKDAPGVMADVAALARALTPEAGPLLAGYSAVRGGAARDREGAKALLARMMPAGAAAAGASASGASGSGAAGAGASGAGPGGSAGVAPALLSLRAELAAQDRSVPSRVARGRATRDLEAVLGRDPADVAAQLVRAELALEDDQPASALDTLRAAEAAAGGGGEAGAAQAAAGGGSGDGAGAPSAPLHLLRARAAGALGVEAMAEESYARALQLEPGLCEAQRAAYELARRRDAVAAADAAVAELTRCPGGEALAAEHARVRGRLDEQVRRLEALLARAPSEIRAAAELADAYVAQRRHDDARRVLAAQRALWPRNAGLLQRLADVEERAGRADEALRLREAALLLDGTDVQLRRAVARARTGKEPLQEFAVDGRKAIADYEASPGEEDAAAAYVLDAAATEVYPDGSQLTRVHVVQKALAQEGVQQVAEVQVPGGAQVLALRTLKRDGRVLEPESLAGKEGVSLPNVQVGDYVEYEYLVAEAARGPAQPGFTASPFYFRISGQPNHRPTYTLVAPKGVGLQVDAHNMRATPPRVEGGREVFQHTESRVPPFLPEPEGPSTTNEVMPFVVVGAGTQGPEALMRAYADAFLDRAAVTHEVEAWAREAAGGKKGLEAARALHAAVMARFQGRDAGLASSAAATVAQDRGSRLMALKAGLAALGLRARVAMVRTFSADPAPYRFPNESLFSYACLVLQLPGEAPVWLDTSVRYGPFGQLPEHAAGGREAYLWPEPGLKLEAVRTPDLGPVPAKALELKLALAADGTLTGEGTDTYVGFEAAALAEAFSQLSGDKRRQALQGALARSFGGAELGAVSVDEERGVGRPFTLRYAFRVPGFARAEGARRVLPPLAFPTQLGRRYLQLSRRETPLVLDATEASTTRVTLELPEGWRLAGPEPRLEVASQFGRLERREAQQGRTVRIEEELRVGQARVAPGEYEAFGGFAGQVDLVQGRDLYLETSGGQAQAP